MIVYSLRNSKIKLQKSKLTNKQSVLERPVDPVFVIAQSEKVEHIQNKNIKDDLSDFYASSREFEKIELSPLQSSPKNCNQIPLNEPPKTAQEVPFMKVRQPKEVRLRSIVSRRYPDRLSEIRNRYQNFRRGLVGKHSKVDRREAHSTGRMRNRDVCK